MPDAHTKGRSAAASSRTAHPFVRIRFMCVRKADDAGFDRGAEICYNAMLPFQKGGAGGMRFTDVLWDFNGTLLDDADAGLACVEELLRRRGLPPLGGIAHYREVFRFPIRDYYADIGFDFAREDYGALADEWALLYGELAADAPLREGVPEALERLRRAGVRLTVLSASERGMLCRQLRQRGVYELFDEVLGLDDFRAQDKLGIAREWRARTGAGRALMVGDTDHDALAARAIGADCVLLTGGHQSREVLLRTGFSVLAAPYEAAEYALQSENETI